MDWVLFTSSIISLGLCAARPVKPSYLAPALSDTELHHLLALLQWHILSMYLCSPACLQCIDIAMQCTNPIPSVSEGDDGAFLAL